MGDTLAISRSLLDQIVARTASSAVEVCGLLFGADRHAGLVPASTQPQTQQMLARSAEWMPEQVRHNDICQTVISIEHCRNLAADPARRFEIDPVALIAAHRAARKGGPMILGHYHSHPSGSPIPSASDGEAASPDGAIWLIATQGEVRAWRAVRDGAVHGRFDPVALVETHACA